MAGSETKQTRQPALTKGRWNRFLELIMGGESVRRICASDDMPNRATIYRAIAKDADKQNAYAFAMQVRAEVMAEDILDIADDGTNDFVKDEDGIERPDHEHIQRSKLRVDARKWLLAKMQPKKYGSPAQVVIVEPPKEPLAGGQHSDADLARVVAEMMQASAERQK